MILSPCLAVICSWRHQDIPAKLGNWQEIRASLVEDPYGRGDTEHEVTAIVTHYLYIPLKMSSEPEPNPEGEAVMPGLTYRPKTNGALPVQAQKADEEKSDGDSDASDASERPLDVNGPDGWEDLEPDVEQLEFKSLVDETKFSDLKSLLEHDRQTWKIDLVKLRVDLRASQVPKAQCLETFLMRFHRTRLPRDRPTSQLHSAASTEWHHNSRSLSETSVS